MPDTMLNTEKRIKKNLTDYSIVSMKTSHVP